MQRRICWADCETVGLNGPVMRFQYAVDDGPIIFIDAPFKREELKPFVELLYSEDVLFIAYAAAFDTYHAYRLVHEFWHGWPLDSPNRPVKPFKCKVLDLQIPAMLHGPFKQFAFSKSKSRAITRIRRIPKEVVEIVSERVVKELSPLLPDEFEISVGVHECKKQPELRTVSFSVVGRASLKAHARYYGAETIELAEHWPMVPRKLEKPWLPYYEEEVYEPYIQEATTILRSKQSAFHLYCRLDIWFLRLLYNKLTGVVEGELKPDHHSDCVHAVAYTRYHGFGVRREVLQRTEEFYSQMVGGAQAALGDINLRSAPQRLKLIQSVDPLIGSTKKSILKELVRQKRPSAKIAKSMLNYGTYRQRLLQVQKILECKTGRWHPDLRVMGTPTGRMAGTSGLNAQGIAQAEWAKPILTMLKWQKCKKSDAGAAIMGIRAAIEAGMGGDFDALEITIAAAAYHDEQLQADLDAGIDLHSMTATMLPEARTAGYTYEQIRDGHKAKDPVFIRLRQTGKTLNFSIIYGAAYVRIAEVIGGSDIEAKEVLRRFFDRYEGIAQFRAEAEKKFCTADTDCWQKASVSRMQEEITDLLGFTRRFTFEREVADRVWRLGRGKFSTGVLGHVIRTQSKGHQSIDNAVRSALLGAAIAIQQAVFRQACNSPVQSVGANLTKILMSDLWNFYRIPLLNIHDELISTTAPTPAMQTSTGIFLKYFRRKVKSLNIQMKPISIWADK